MKSGVEYLAQHPGWKTQTAEKKKTGIVIGIDELSKILLRIDDALESPSEDFYHDTLYSLRDQLAEFVEDPERMVE